MWIRSLFAIVPFILIGLHAYAQETCSFTLQGVVQDDHDATGLDLADVYVVELGRSVLADKEGRFTIDGLCAGTWTLRVAHIGCTPVEMKVRVPGKGPLRVRMEHHAEELKEVEVARARPDENVGHAHKSIGTEEMEKDAGRTLGEMLARVSGVTAMNSGPTISKPIIHGLSGNRVLILNQGVRQEDQQWGTEHAPNLDPLSSDRITVVKGAASVQYGSDAIGGVVITEPVELPREGGISGEVRGLGVWNGRGGGGNALLQGGVKGLRGIGWRVQGSGRCMGDSEAPRYVLSNTGLREAGGSASFGYRDHRWSATVFYSFFQRELGILRAAHIGNLTDLQNAIASGTPWTVGDFTRNIDAPRQTAAHHLVKAEAGYAVSERNRVVITYAYQSDDRQEYDIRRGGRDAKPALDLDLATHTGDVVLKHWLGAHVHGKLGVSGAHQQNINSAGTGVRPLIPNYRKQNGGVFLIEHLPVSERLELEVGARLEHTLMEVAKFDGNNTLVRPEHDFTNAAFAAGGDWSLMDSVRLRFHIASAYRPPHVSELYSEGLHHGSAAIEEGDAGLDNERAVKGTIDLEAELLRGRLRVEATVHASRIDDFIYLRPSGTRLTIRGAFPVFNHVATDAFLHGADLSFSYRLTGPWHWKLRGSTVRARDLSWDEWLFQMPGDRVGNALHFETARAGAWRELEVAIGSQVVFEQRRIPIGLDYTGPPGTYHLLSLQASASRPMGQNAMRIGLSAQNLLNSAYRDYLDRFRYYADARGLELTFWVRYSFGEPRH